MENHLKTGGEMKESSSTPTCTALSPESISMLKDLRQRRKYRFVTLMIDDGGVVMPDKTQPSSAHWKCIRDSLPYSDCRYGILEQDIVTNDGRTTSRLVFLVWMPSYAQAHTKMAYSTGKFVIRNLEGFGGGLVDIAATSWEEFEQAMGEDDGDGSESDIDM